VAWADYVRGVHVIGKRRPLIGRGVPSAAWVFVIGSALLLTACGGGNGLFDDGEVRVAGVAHWSNEFGEGGSVLEVVNDTGRVIEIAQITLPVVEAGPETGFVIVDAGQEVDRKTGARSLPPGPLAPLPLAIASGERVELHVIVELRSCDAVGDWYVDPDEQMVSFRTTVMSPFEVQFADGQTHRTTGVPPIGTMPSLQPEVCGA